MSEANTSPAFQRGLTPDQQIQAYFAENQGLRRELTAEQKRSDLRLTAAIALGNAVERQRRIEELSPAARNLEQRDIGVVYKASAALLEKPLDYTT